MKIQDITAKPKLKQLMKERGLVQQDVGKATGINPATLTRFDVQKSFDMRHVYVLMDYFGFTKLEDLFDFTIEENEQDDS